MIKNILALLDFSDITNQVVERTGELGKFYQAKCWLIHVATPDPEFVGYDVGPKYIRDHRADVLKDEHRTMQGYKKQLSDNGVDCEALLIMGQVNPTIIAEIQKLEVDLVVLGSHGHSRLYEFLVGSVCEYMLRHAKVPMLVIPSQ